MVQQLDIDSKTISPISPRRREILMEIEFGKRMFECPGGPRDSLVFRVGAEASVEREAIENCVQKRYEMSAKSGVIIRRLDHP
jgi:hypothetical protein